MSFQFIGHGRIYPAICVKDKGKLAEVKNTVSVEAKIPEGMKDLKDKHPDAFRAIMYDALFKEVMTLDYKADWYVPMFHSFFVFEDTVSMDFDVLREVKKNK